MGCNQGRNCPVRATRNAGVCNPEPDEEQTRDDVVAFVVLLTPETSGARSASALGDLLARPLRTLTVRRKLSTL